MVLIRAQRSSLLAFVLEVVGLVLVDLEAIAVKAIQPVVGADPQKTLSVLEHFVDAAVGEPLLSERLPPNMPVSHLQLRGSPAIRRLSLNS